MSYTIKYTDQVNKGTLTVNDSTFNTDTSLSFPGRNQRGYSVAIAENFLHLLENFANNTAPLNPVEGQMWYDTTAGVENLKVYDGTSWKLAGSIKKSSNTPDTAILGDLWVDTDNQQLFLFNGASWVLVGPTFSSGLRTGVVAETVLDTADLNKVILSTYIDDQVVSIFSLESFVPKVAIEGFASIQSGINLSSNTIIQGDMVYVPKYWGIAEKAESLIIGSNSVPATSFLRKDTSNVTDYAFTIRNNQGVTTGQESQLRLYVDEGQIGSVYHATINSAFDIRLNYNNNITTLVRVDSTGRVGVGVNNFTPEETLDVIGTSRFTDLVKVKSTANVGDSLGAALQVSGGLSVAKDISVSGNVSLTGQLLVGNVAGTNNLAIKPYLDNTYDIGYQNPSLPSERLRFRNIYATTFHGDLVGNIVGNVTGQINGPATRLLSSTSFSISGDVTSPGFSFDGGLASVPAGEFIVGRRYRIFTIGTTDFTLIGAPSNTVGTIFTATGVGIGTGVATTADTIFTTTISSNFITTKEELPTPDGADELLVYRNSSGTLGKMSRANFLSRVSFVPVGTILPFAGSQAPNGYLFCDGSEKKKTDYPDLFSIIGYTYGLPEDSFYPLQGSNTFRLPDLRGRFPMGNTAMDNADSVPSNLGVIDSNTQPVLGTTQNDAGIVGYTHGTDSVTLEVTNLPDHQHSFVGDEGTAFYAIRNNTEATEDSGSFSGNGPTEINSGQYIETTGSMIGKAASTQPLDIMNPYLTINYIIFTGKFN